MHYTQKLDAVTAAIQAYEDALSDYRRILVSSGDGEASISQVEEAQEEVNAARSRFVAAELAMNS